MSQSNASQNVLVRSIEETLSLTMAGSLKALENLSQRLNQVARNAAKEHDRVAEIAGRLGSFETSSPLAKALGLDLADEAAADVCLAFKIHCEAADLVAGVATEEADRVNTLADEVRAILPAAPVPVPSAPPVEPTPPVIVPAPQPNPAPPTPTSEESVQVAANSAILEAPAAPLVRGWDPDEAKMVESLRSAPLLASLAGPPDEDESEDESDDEDDGSDNEGTDLAKQTLEEAFVEVFGEPVSTSDEARAAVVAAYPDADVGLVHAGRGRTYFVVTATRDGRRRRISKRKATPEGAWTSAAASLES